MKTLDQLEELYSIEGELGFFEDDEGLISITVSNKYADAEIYLQGAQVTSFAPVNSMDILWMSPDSLFEAGKAIRGGIPLCFPWFGPSKEEGQPQHGFARLMNWDVTEVKNMPNSETFIRLQLCSSEETKAYWPHDFCAELLITVARTLTASLKVTNTSTNDFEYTCALHSYFNVSDIEHIAIDGLKGTQYRHSFAPEVFTQEEDLLEIKQEENRYYFNTEATCVIEDLAFKRKIEVGKSGSKVTVVWNPGEENCTKMNDVPDHGYLNFVCVEAVNSLDDVIKLSPQQSHETSVILGIQSRF